MSAASSALANSAPRHEVLYARIKPVNKKFLDDLVAQGKGDDKKKPSLSVVVDRLLDKLREDHGNDSNGRKS